MGAGEDRGGVEALAKAHGAPVARLAEIAERQQARGDGVGLQQDEARASGVIAREHVGAAPPAQEPAQQVGVIPQRLDLAELDDLGRVGPAVRTVEPARAGQQRRVRPVEQRRLRHALQPVAAGGHRHAQHIGLVGGEDRARRAQRGLRHAMGDLGARARHKAQFTRSALRKSAAPVQGPVP